MTTKSPRLALFKYPGGKVKTLSMLHSYLDPLLTNATAFHECFVGGGPLLLSVAHKYPDLPLFANDKDDVVASFWRVVSDMSPEGDKNFDYLLSRVDIVPTIDMFWAERELEKFPDRPVEEKAFHCVFFHKTTFSGLYEGSPIGGKNQTGKWKVGCNYTAKNIITRLTEARKRVGGRLTVSCQNILTYLDGVDPGAVAYLDPPYYEAGQHLYRVSMSNFEHGELARKLQTVPFKWVMSYDDCPAICGLYEGWADVRRETFRYSFAINKKVKEEGWKDKSELVILKKDQVPL